mmetsp:Transcript_19401/g.35082  ORF Transcript_19401/g.35082 Transcript_19401/m.35082 type:complete len:447 (-) Transcript_19401:329-1669(-)
MASSAPTRPLRPSIALKHHHQANRSLLSVQKSDLASQIAYHGDHLKELKLSARSTNNLIRSHYSDFIHEVGRSLFPVIIFTDYEVDGPSGVGSTLTLYRADGSQTKVSPALQTNYELYKTCGHLLMGLGVEIGPYLANASLCCGDLVGGGDIGNKNSEELDSEPAFDSSRAIGYVEDVSWGASLTEYLQRVRIYRQALMRAVEVEAVAEDMNLAIGSQEDDEEDKHNSSHGLPPLEIRETMFAMLTSVIDFCESCLSTGVLDVQRWEQLNQENFPRIKQCMKAAVKAQADACVRKIIDWREMIGPKEWKDLYVVIPTVWAVGAENPRKTMMRQFMDEDRIDSHIIVSEYPRDHGEARTLLGRIVGDRSIGRFVFGDDTEEQKVKTMGLSSEVDVVQDDALPAIWDAMKSNGCPVRRNQSSIAMQSVERTKSTQEMPMSKSHRPSFC